MHHGEFTIHVRDDCDSTALACRYRLEQPDGAVCAGDTFCLWLTSREDLTAPPREGIIGLDYSLAYDPALLQPTGRYTLGSVPQPGRWTAQVNTGTAGRVHTSLYYDDSQANAQFADSGRVMCLEFVVLNAFATSPVWATEIREGYLVTERFACADTLNLAASAKTEGNYRVSYWLDPARPLASDPAHVPTQVSATNASCQAVEDPRPVAVDAQGNFAYDAQPTDRFTLLRDIPGKGPASSTNLCTDVMTLINGMDCYVLGEITSLRPQLSTTNAPPTPFQMIAGDVNANDVLAASDITLIQQRAVGLICDFPQSWNTNWSVSNNTNPVPASYDWRFVGETALTSWPDYQLSASYPSTSPNDLGYHRDNVPNVPACHTVLYRSDSECLEPQPEHFGAILLGDVDGSWQSASAAVAKTAATNYRMVFALDRAQELGNRRVRFPVIARADTVVVALDFAVRFDTTRLRYVAVHRDSVHGNNISPAWNHIQNHRLLLTCFMMRPGGFSLDVPTFWIEAELQGDGPLTDEALQVSTSLLNGKPAEPLKRSTPTGRSVTGTVHFSLYPNPTSGQLNVQASEALHWVGVFDALGREVLSLEPAAGATSVALNATSLPHGVYVVKIQTSGGSSQAKVVKQ